MTSEVLATAVCVCVCFVPPWLVAGGVVVRRAMSLLLMSLSGFVGGFGGCDRFLPSYYRGPGASGHKMATFVLTPNNFEPPPPRRRVLPDLETLQNFVWAPSVRAWDDGARVLQAVAVIPLSTTCYTSLMACPASQQVEHAPGPGAWNAYQPHTLATSPQEKRGHHWFLK